MKVSEDGDGLTFYWRKSINGDIFKPIGFKILKKTIAGPGGWVVASDDLFAEDRHCTVIGGSFKTHRYKVVALYKDRTSVGQEAVMTDDLGVQIHSESRCVLCPFVPSSHVYAFSTYLLIAFRD